jgi:hypothetical protein
MGGYGRWKRWAEVMIGHDGWELWVSKWLLIKKGGVGFMEGYMERCGCIISWRLERCISDHQRGRKKEGGLFLTFSSIYHSFSVLLLNPIALHSNLVTGKVLLSTSSSSLSSFPPFRA